MNSLMEHNEVILGVDILTGAQRVGPSNVKAYRHNNAIITKLEGDVNHPPSNSEGTLSSTHSLSNDRRVPSSQQVFIAKTNNATVDPKSLIGFVPSYNGDAFTLYNYINCAKQWLIIAGGKAAISISMIDHGFKFSNVELALKQECGDNREFNTLLIELANVKRKGSYKDLIFEIKQKLSFL
ncbi:unnamed protein product [Leptidea sinapis]|uniref:Uncharacterized protein n=1 Tax=Leptidea sinapis TaxID=189913 RepID=A0A5E4PYN2_9NEOP|nr:unnamed protein product [Leptidea sinapis]